MPLGSIMTPLIMGALVASSPTKAPPPIFAGIFDSHAVIQRDRPITIWGSAAAGTDVEVALGRETTRTKTDGKGHWRATLPAMTAGGPYEMSVRSAQGTTTLSDIMLGDVVLCAGQSNMKFPARLSTGAWSGLRGAANNALRFTTVAETRSAAPADDLRTRAEWKVATPDTVAEASAVCYYMSRSLQRTEKVPIGFVTASTAGSTVQSWIDAESLRVIPGYANGVDDVLRRAANPALAQTEEARREEAWWDAHDPSAASERAFLSTAFDDSSWPTITPSGPWKDANIPALAAFDGVVWFRKSVVLSAAQATNANELLLGQIDTFDTTWINGQRIGGSSKDWIWRDYKVPAGVFHAGTNEIVLRVLSSGAGGGGLTGAMQDKSIKTSDGRTIMLSGAWRYKIGMPARGLTPPATSWEGQAGLTTLYNGMIAPIAGYGYKLVAWDQGESNIGAAQDYGALLKSMMASWRRAAGQPDLPFVIVQLSGYGDAPIAPGSSDWAAMRNAQAEAARDDGHAALAATIDVSDRFDYHSPQKTVVGERMARAVRAIAYGEALAPSGPEATDVARLRDDLVVQFRNSGGGLRAYGSDSATAFETCRADDCHYVHAEVSGDTVILRGAGKSGASHVRYAWADAPIVNLFGGDGLPAGPFDLPVR